MLAHTYYIIIYAKHNVFQKALTSPHIYVKYTFAHINFDGSKKKTAQIEIEKMIIKYLYVYIFSIHIASRRRHRTHIICI